METFKTKGGKKYRVAQEEILVEVSKEEIQFYVYYCILTTMPSS